jgi:hypothetical protein
MKFYDKAAGTKHASGNKFLNYDNTTMKINTLTVHK